MRDDGGEIFELTPALIVRACGLANAAEIRTPRLVAELDKSARQRLHHLVVERAAKERMRMRDQRNADRGAVRRIHGALDTAHRSGDEFAAGTRPHILSRSTT